MSLTPSLTHFTIGTAYSVLRRASRPTTPHGILKVYADTFLIISLPSWLSMKFSVHLSLLFFIVLRMVPDSQPCRTFLIRPRIHFPITQRIFPSFLFFSIVRGTSSYLLMSHRETGAWPFVTQSVCCKYSARDGMWIRYCSLCDFFAVGLH